MKTKIEIFPNVLQLNHTGPNALRRLFDINIRNTDSKPITFKFSHLPSPSTYSYDSGVGGLSTLFPPTLLPEKVAKVQFGEGSAVVRPGSTYTLRLKIEPPKGFDDQRLPMFSGFIELKGSNNETFSVPYAGKLATISYLPESNLTI